MAINNRFQFSASMATLLCKAAELTLENSEIGFKNLIVRIDYCDYRDKMSVINYLGISPITWTYFSALPPSTAFKHRVANIILEWLRDEYLF